MGEVFAGFAAAMGAGIMMVCAVLVLLFGSFLQPVTILFSLPLSIGGAIVALAVTGQPISLPVVIGILMLMGIVPAVFAVMDDIGGLAWRLFSRFVGPSEEPAAATLSTAAEAERRPLPAAAE